jgi:hypothetical protein
MTKSVIDSNHVYLNVLKNTAWISDGIVGLDRTRNKYKLVRAPKKMGKWAGDMISFGANDQFTSFYSAFCGNDCFTAAYGHYQLMASARVEFLVDSITYSGDCKKATEYFPYYLKLSFQLKQKNDTLYLTKK